MRYNCSVGVCVHARVCVCYSQAAHTSGKREVTSCLLRHLTFQPHRAHTHTHTHTHTHSLTLTHCGFSSHVPKYHDSVHRTDTQTHTHLQAGGDFFFSLACNSACVESAPNRPYSYQDDLLTLRVVRLIAQSSSFSWLFACVWDWGVCGQLCLIAKKVSHLFTFHVVLLEWFFFAVVYVVNESAAKRVTAVGHRSDAAFVRIKSGFITRRWDLFS